MPLPNYGYFNKETKQNQELIFEMPPKIVDVDEDSSNSLSGKHNRKKAQITTGKLGIELERKMVINNDDPNNVWQQPHLDRNDIECAKSFNHNKDIREDVKKDLDSLISARKLKELRSNRDKPLPQRTPSFTSTPTLSTPYIPKREEPSAIAIPVRKSSDPPAQYSHTTSSVTNPGGYSLSTKTYSVQETRRSYRVQPCGRIGNNSSTFSLQ